MTAECSSLIGQRCFKAVNEVALAAEGRGSGDVVAVCANEEQGGGERSVAGSWGSWGTCLHCLALGASELLCLGFIPANSSVGTETEKP